MIDPKTFKEVVDYNKIIEQESEFPSPNPLSIKATLANLNLQSNYSQVIPIPTFDKDSIDILHKVDQMNNISPFKLFLPYSYKIDEINGDRIFNKDGSLAFIVEYESEIVREYYPDKNNIYVKTILEKNKNEVLSKIEPVVYSDDDIKVNIIIFDSKINKKYTMFHIEENEKIVSITEFFEQSKNFRTLFRNRITSSPERYVESRENVYGELELVDCKLNPLVQEIKKTVNDRVITIKYENNKKIIDVRRKMPD